MMKRMFGVKKEKASAIEEASNRSSKRGDSVDEKIKRLDSALSKYREQIRRTQPGPAREAIKARALLVLKQKRIYEGQRDILCSQSFSLDQVAYAADELKDAQQSSSKRQGSGQFSRSFLCPLMGTCCLPLEK